MDMKAWLHSTIGDTPYQTACRKAGLSDSALSNAVRRGSLDVRSVIAISRAYRVNPVQSLIDLGYITEAEARKYAGQVLVSDLSLQDLTRELYTRILGGGNTVKEELIAMDPPGAIQSNIHVVPLDADLPDSEGADGETLAQMVYRGELKAAAQPATEPLTEPEQP